MSIPPNKKKINENKKEQKSQKRDYLEEQQI